MAVDFSKLTGKVIDDSIKPPPALPAGQYYGRISKHLFQESQFDKQDANGNRLEGQKEGIVRYVLKVDEPDGSIADQVSDDMLKGRQLFRDYSIEPEGLWVVRKFWESLGLTVDGRSVGEVAPEAVGHQVVFDVTQRVDKRDASKVYNDVRSVKPRAA